MLVDVCCYLLLDFFLFLLLVSSGLLGSSVPIDFFLCVYLILPPATLSGGKSLAACS